MSVTVIVSLKVAEFSKWKAGFDAHAEDRAEAGLNAVAHQNIDDPNNAIVIVTAPSKEAFLAFFTRPETQKMQKKAGVLGPPEIKFINPA
jgi:ABC-type glycerol-3-phosphate transport system substrate-binding protein